MRKKDYQKFRVYAFMLLLAALSACQNQTPPQEEQSEADQDVVNESNEEQFDMMLAWNEARSDSNQLQSIFEVGNRFSFLIPEDCQATAIHAYLGYSDEQLSLYLIDAAADSAGTYENPEFHWIDTALLSDEFFYLNDSIEVIKEDNKDTIPLDTAINRINNWSNADKRANWIQNDSIMLLFEIHKKDMTYGVQHYAYLGLIEGDSMRADLILVNETSDPIMYNLEDMTAPIPPFDPNGKHRKGTAPFGLLQYLKIN